VETQKLLKMPHLNGKKATVIKFDEHDQRWQVVFDHDGTVAGLEVREMKVLTEGYPKSAQDILTAQGQGAQQNKFNIVHELTE